MPSFLVGHFYFWGVPLVNAFPTARVGLLWASLRYGASHDSLRSSPPHPSRDFFSTKKHYKQHSDIIFSLRNLIRYQIIQFNFLFSFY